MPTLKILMQVFVAVIGIVLSACLAAEKSVAPEITADLILVNGEVYTLSPDRGWAEALAIKDGYILAVGSTEDMRVYKGASTLIEDVGGRMVMPGIIDSHVHTLSAGLTNLACRLPGTFTNPDLEDFTASLMACNERFKDEPILMGRQFSQTAIPADKFNKAFLDSLIPDRPVMLADESGHVKWLNSKALSLAGITRDTSSPAGGKVVKGEDGEPTGVLLSNAEQLLARFAPPPPDRAERLRALDWAFGRASELGVTAMMDAIVLLDDMSLWAEFLSGRETAQRMNLCAWISNNDEDIPDPQYVRAAFDNAGFGPDVKLCAKLYLDGTPQAGTAAFLEPYADRDTVGKLGISVPVLQKTVRDYDDAGIMLKSHAIGDRAVREGLNAYESVILARGGNAHRHHMVHSSIIHPDDLPRYKQLGVPTEMIGTIAALIPYVKVSYYEPLGSERFHERYQPAGALIHQGAVLGANSDWGAGILHPMRSIQTLMTRKDPNDPDGAVAGAQHRVDLPTAIAMHTINNAYILHREDDSGSLEPGKRADLIVLNQNLFEIPVEDIRKTKVLLTLIGGETAWRTDGF